MISTREVQEAQGLGFVTALVGTIPSLVGAGASLFSTFTQAGLKKKQIRAGREALATQVQMAREQRAHELELARMGGGGPVATATRLLPYVAVAVLAWWVLKT